MMNVATIRLNSGQILMAADFVYVCTVAFVKTCGL